MLIGVPREIKADEYRVGLTPASVRELVTHGHKVLVEHLAGDVIGLHDEDYTRAGGQICATAEEIFAQAELIVKVKEPQPAEVAMLREGQVLFTYLHLAADAELTRNLAATGCTAIAYETVTDRFGALPLLAPMSEVAGRMSVQAGAHCLEIEQGGRGILMGGVSGTPAAKVTILGGGVVGANAARVALGMEADVNILDISLHTLTQLDTHFGGGLNTVFSTVDALQQCVAEADLVIGAVLVPGASTPKLVTEDMVRDMKKSAVLVDVAVDQGGCAATSKPTTHSNPTYRVHDVVHYCVANMPGAVARTSAFALNNATLPFVLALANQGAHQAMAADIHLRHGLNLHAGHVTYASVAAATGLMHKPAEEALGL
ncbi:ald [Symbiodinium pilosum]|jgi:alanine dehydrogenase|uniref:alanine dehydrogenase n=2 Tax=Symbiodinium TaxID=2949 RepID=A0A812RZ74_SYMPI|nr:alanine dehydrogenase [Pseudomonadales bacterium]CAE7459178.1 ald [Symbiodinium pilosum]CAE7565033.1 ald [Symbiodinium necroappetens]